MSSRRLQSHENNSFKVFIRIRPFNQYELEMASNRDYMNYNQKQISVKIRNENPTFTFDQVYHPITSQEEIFQTVADDVIDNAFLGINGTIFCYGQTASGKTHTIVGDYSSEFSKQQGLMPRILREVIQRKNTKIYNIKQSRLDIRIKVSMIEIYNQKILDLLDLNKKNLKMRQNKKQGVFIENVTEKYVVTAEQAMNYVKLGLQNRTVGRTNLNAYSSRSHMVFIITIHETNFQTREAKSAKITLTDLAGSQKLSKTGVEGKMLIQAKKINTSLSTLGKVIQALSEKSNHVPYRDSKLTRLLQQSIGGNSLTRLIINVSPSYINEYQTITSLRFGSRAKMIKNKPKVNKEYTVEELLILLEKAEMKIKQQIKIIEELQLGHSSHFSRRNGGFAGLGYQRPITMHMIGDDDEEYDDSSSVGSRSIAKSVVSEQDKYNVSIFGEQGGFFNKTSEFEFEGSPINNKIRKPNLCYSKSMKTIMTMDIQGDNELDEMTGLQKPITSSDRKEKKTVKIMECKGSKEDQDAEERDGIIYEEIGLVKEGPLKKSIEPNFEFLSESEINNLAVEEKQQEQARNCGIYDNKEEDDKTKNQKDMNIVKLSDITNIQSPVNDVSLAPLSNALYHSISKSHKDRQKNKQNDLSLLRQQLKQQLRDQLKQHIKEEIKQQLQQRIRKQCKQQIKQQLEQKIRKQFKQEIMTLTSKFQSVGTQMKATQVKFQEMKFKYEQTIQLVEEQKQSIKVKDLHIFELKEKYKAKKHQINQQINKLKSFWQVGS